MKVVVVGGTGYIGSVVGQRLAEKGHDVVTPSRAEADLENPESLRSVAAGADVVIHAAQVISREVDLAVIDALASTSARLIYTSGVWVLGATSNGVAGEDAPTNPIAIVGHRPEVERRVLDAGGAVIRPGIVYGRGGGIPAMLVGKAAEHGHGRFVGDSATRWPMVHVDDLADLFALAAQRDHGPTVFHGVSQSAVPVADIARAAATAANASTDVQAWTPDQAQAEFGEVFAEALALDQEISSQRTRETLRWVPTRPGVVDDLVPASS
jgi:nucleoside-diphosphate-sugar epimerase